MSRKIHIYGNWKMNQLTDDIYRFFDEMEDDSLAELKCQGGIAPQFPHLSLVKEKAMPLGIKTGAQNCSHQTSGAFTGDTSPAVLKDLDLDFVILGHSERRTVFGESNQTINEKTLLALELGLDVVFCIGETLEEREANKTFDVLKAQLDEGLKGVAKEKHADIIIAYEPVWAIGTGKVATPDQAQEAHAYIRKHLAENHGFNKESLIIQYGGSVKPANAHGLLSLPDIDGALVGGASLKPGDFYELMKIGSELTP